MDTNGKNQVEKLDKFLIGYFNYLREEINLRITRHSYFVIYKLIAIGAILAFFLEYEEFPFDWTSLIENTQYVIWIIPFISTIFDMIILGNLRVVANIGIYIQEYYEKNVLDKWKRKDPILKSFEFWETCGAHEKTKWKCYTPFDMGVIYSITFFSILLLLVGYIYLLPKNIANIHYWLNVIAGVLMGLLSLRIFADMCKLASGKKSFMDFLKGILKRKEVVTMKKLQEDIAKYLDQQGLGEISEEMAKIINEHVLTWKVGNKSDPKETDTIFAFSFGFHLDENGARKPGLKNRQLADKVVKYYNEKPRRVYVQWSIYEALDGRISEEDLIPIYPETDPEKSITKHLSTKDMLERIVEKLKPKEPEDIGPVLIIAHRDHLARCVRMAEEKGFAVATVQDEMPGGYDWKSAQLWTTDRITYIVSDVIS
ncbi:MAG: phosphatase PAP2 family protein [Theionarchaea archaeon]|nr:phosphatase PAP2 family protein [Theionarchaea archaeon]